MVKVDAVGSGDTGEFTFEGIDRDDFDEPRGGKKKVAAKAAAGESDGKAESSGD